jgi:predicted nucleic acid-binding protein
VKCLLDVSTLVALGIAEHEFHERVAIWIRDAGAAEPLELLTCSITEIGFVRIVAQTPQYTFSVSEARTLLLRLKAWHGEVFTFIADAQDATGLPGWVKHPKQVTDGHLVQLAKAQGAVVATLDTGIPGAFLVPARQ